MTKSRPNINSDLAAEPGRMGRVIAGQLGEITLEKVTEEGFANARLNAEKIARGKGIVALRDTALMKGDRALVIAAGPSLHRYDTAKIIKESKFNGIIVATESSMSWCLRNDIIPDLVVTLDPHAHRIVRWFGDPDLNEEALVKDDYFARQDMDPKFRQDQLKFNRELIELINRFGSKMHIALSSSASQKIVRRVEESGMKAYWWNPMYDDYDKAGSLTQKIHKMNKLPCVNAGGNVGSACWVMAHAILDKKAVGLVGMDFGYYADTPFDCTQYYKEILTLVGPDRLEEVYVRIKNPHLNADFYTDPAYLWYRNGFLEMAQQADCVTYNCTGGGILFGEKIIWSDLRDFLKGK